MANIRCHSFSTGWGFFGYASREGQLLATYLPQSQRALLVRMEHDFPDAEQSEDGLDLLEQDVSRYFLGERVRFRVSIDVSNVPPFRRAVLEACRRIPYGQTASYADLARDAGNARAVRAAGGAMAHNPLPLVIPCHRVLRSDGTIGGFSSPSGVEEKLRMLRLEGVVLSDGHRFDLRQAV